MQSGDEAGGGGRRGRRSSRGLTLAIIRGDGDGHTIVPFETRGLRVGVGLGVCGGFAFQTTSAASGGGGRAR